MSKRTEIELYGAVQEDTELLYERACSAYLDLLDRDGKAPRLQAVADRLVELHPDEYPSSGGVMRALATKDFHEELRIRRKEHLISNLGPQLLMAEAAVEIGRQALEERLERLKDPERRATISDRDLDNIIRMASELSAKVDKELEEVAQSTAINKGTIVNLFTQLAPERAAVVMQELARLERAKEYSDA